MTGLSDGRYALGICDRCNFKMQYQRLRADGNSSSLRVCEACWDPKTLGVFRR